MSFFCCWYCRLAARLQLLNRHTPARGYAHTVATSTPDKTATVAAQSTAAAQTILAELEDIPYQDGRLLWQQEKPLIVSLKGPGWGYVEIDDNLVCKNFILKSDVTWDATGIIICGAVFRSEPDLVNGKQYEFMYLRLFGLPAWQIAYNKFGKFDNTDGHPFFNLQ